MTSLLELATRLGATGASVISTSDILLKTDLQKYAKKHVVKVMAAQRAVRPMLQGLQCFVNG